MQKIKLFILMSLFLTMTINLFSQSNFKWERVDSCGKTKDVLYTDTKIFIADSWKSAQNVIQNDDKDGDNIINNTNILDSNTNI
jgi:hypothetical protein